MSELINRFSLFNASKTYEQRNFLNRYWFRLILFLFLGTMADVSYAQSTGSDSCRGLIVEQNISAKLVNDSNIFICLGDTLRIKDNSYDTLQNGQVDVKWTYNSSFSQLSTLYEDTVMMPFNRTIVFEISNDSGCTKTKEYRIFPLDFKSEITVNDPVQCFTGHRFDFAANTTLSNRSSYRLDSVSWTATNGLDTSIESFSYRLGNADTVDLYYFARLDTFGCVYHDTTTVVVNPSVTSSITQIFGDSLLCLQPGFNDSFAFSRSIEIQGDTIADITVNSWSMGTDVYSGDTLTWSFDYSNNAFGTNLIYHRVTTDAGCTWQDSLDVYIARPISADISFLDASICEGEPFQILNNTITDSLDALKVLYYVWESGDTLYSRLDTVQSYLNDTGEHEVQIFTRTQLGCVSSDTVKGRLNSVSPLDWKYSEAIKCEGDTSALVFTSIGSAGSRSWLIDGTIKSSDSIFRYYPSAAGLDTLVLSLENTAGCRSSLALEVGLSPKPVAYISRTTFDSCLNNVQSFRIDNQSSDAKISKVKWSFSDGTEVFDTTVSKAFVSVGSTTFTAEVEDEMGCLDTASRTLLISNPPSARFSASALSSCEDNQKFVFYDSSTTSVGTITSISWIFSDGTLDVNSSVSAKKHTFSGSGIFKLSLAVLNSEGCVDTFSENITVFAKPTANFSVDNSTQCLNLNSFELTNLSTSNSGQNNLGYYWSFGDSTSSKQKSLAKQYNKGGSYQISLVITSPQGCSDSTSTYVRVLDLPEAKFTINDSIQCIDKNEFELKDVSVNNTGSGTINFREWAFGDNTTQTGTNVSKKYSAAGSYDIVLFAYLSNGCYDSVIRSIQVNPSPNVNFTVNKDTQCLTNNNFVFRNQSSIVPGGGSISYQWVFDDTLTSNNVHPSISFASFGDFKVKLRATSQYGCLDEDSIPVQVVASPVVLFSSSRSFQQCNSTDTFEFSNNTQALNGKGLRFSWDLGDGNSSSFDSLIHSYSNPGTYTVLLKATNDLGCSDSTSESVTIYPDPVVNFTVNDNTQCFLNQDIQAVNKSQVGFNGGALDYKWKLNNDSITNSRNVSLTKLNTGTYNLTLEVMSTKGCKDSLTKNVSVLNSPKAEFIINDSLQCLAGNSFKMSNSSVGVNAGSYQWDFGDGTGSKSTNPVKSFQSYGKYKVKLIAITQQGCTDTSIQDLEVYSQPNVGFSINDSTQCLSKNEFEFIPIVNNPDGSSVQNYWDFGDKQTAQKNKVSYTYSNSGIYVVQLKSLTANGCSDSITKKVRVYHQPQSIFTVNKAKQCLSGNDFVFDNLSSVKGNTSLNYTWSFGDASSKVNSANPKYSYSKVGQYQVRLISTSIFNCVDTFTSNVIVNPQPNISFTTTDTGFCVNGGAVQFNNTSTVSLGSLTYVWDFDDGRMSGGLSPSHSFGKAGDYQVKLISTTNLGCKDSLTKKITIHPKPELAFTLNNTNQCKKGNTFVVSNSSTISKGSLSYFWDWSDGTTSTLESPSHRFLKAGVYNLTQSAESNFGCKDTLRHKIQVWVDPLAAHDINDSIQCDADNEFFFQNQSTIAFGKFETKWEYGDKTIKKSFNGRHTYANPGTYEVLQIVESGNGCLDTAKTMVKVTERPRASFALNMENQCSKYNRFEGKNNSVYNGPETVSYTWDLDNAETKSSKDLVYSYKEFGKYDIKLSVITAEGCLDSMVRSVNVYPQGTSKLKLLRDTYCFYNNVVRFGNDSRVDGDEFTSLKWTFGDGFSRAVLSTNPLEYSYNTTGTFDISLITTTNNLCKDTSEGTVTILPMPKAIAEVNQSIYCFNEQAFEFSDKSSNPTKKTTREWIMERRVFSTNTQYEHAFSKAGNQLAMLVIKDEFGCTDTSRLELIVNPTPEANFIINRSEQCLENNYFNLVNTSTGSDGKEGLWRPESGAAGFEKDFEYSYFKHGLYDIILTVYSDSGCYDTIARTVQVNPTPEGQITFNYACVGADVNFSANDTIQSGLISTYEWSLGDGKFTNDREPTYSYKFNGKFDVKLKMISDKGCILRLMDSMFVYPNPEPLIGLYTGRSTVNTPEVQFYDSSFDGPYLSYEWYFGDGSDPLYDYEVSHKYKDSGTYTVMMVATSFDLCIDTGYRTIRIWPDFNLLFPTAFSPNDDGINDTYKILGKFQSIDAIAIEIFNERGNLVYSTNNVLEGWNGRINNVGDPASAGTYLIQVRLKDIYNKQFQTTERINLVR